MSEDELILTHILQCRQSDLLLHKPVLTGLQQQQFDSYKSRRATGEPLQYILGTWEFYGLELMVDRRVLVPRPETEQVVEAAIERFKGKDILDLGTGSGNIAITLAKNLPHANIVSVDISRDALDVAKANALRHGVDDRIHFVHQDMADYLGKVKNTFDLIISNPPYVPKGDMGRLPKDVLQEPHLALNGGVDGLDFYRTIIKYSPFLLRAGGCLMMEFGDGQGTAIETMILTQTPLKNIEIIKDLAGKDRGISAVFI